MTDECAHVVVADDVAGCVERQVADDGAGRGLVDEACGLLAALAVDGEVRQYVRLSVEGAGVLMLGITDARESDDVVHIDVGAEYGVGLGVDLRGVVCKPVELLVAAEREAVVGVRRHVVGLQGVAFLAESPVVPLVVVAVHGRGVVAVGGLTLRLAAAGEVVEQVDDTALDEEGQRSGISIDDLVPDGLGAADGAVEQVSELTALELLGRSVELLALANAVGIDHVGVHQVTRVAGDGH